MRKGWLRAATLAALLLALAGCGTASATTTASTSQFISSAVSLEQVGGLRVILGVEASHEQQTLVSLVARARTGLGVSGASGKALPDNQVEIDLPGYTNRAVAAGALSAQGELRFIDVGQTALPLGATVSAGQYPTILTGDDISQSSVRAMVDQQHAQPVVIFAFLTENGAAQKFAQYTGSHIGSYLTVTLDGKVIESATIQAEIAGLVQIGGLPSLTAAQTLAAEMKSAALPTPVTLVSATIVQKGAAQAGGGGAYMLPR